MLRGLANVPMVAVRAVRTYYTDGNNPGFSVGKSHTQLLGVSDRHAGKLIPPRPPIADMLDGSANAIACHLFSLRAVLVRRFWLDGCCGREPLEHCVALLAGWSIRDDRVSYLLLHPDVVARGYDTPLLDRSPRLADHDPVAETQNQTSALFTDLIDAALDDRQSGLRVALPGRIESYDKATRRATVQLLVQDGHVDGDGERQTTTIPPLTDVPVMRVGSGVERFKFPVRSGDRCLVSFSSSSIAKLKSVDDIVDPDDDRHHHEADGIAIPGLFFGGADPAGTFIEIDDQDVLHLGGSPAPHPVLLTNAFLSQLNTLVSAIGDAMNSIPEGTVAAGEILAALDIFNSAVASYTSQKVKVL